MLAEVSSTALATPEPGEGGDAEPADDGGIREQEERLGDECEERGHGEGQHLAVLAGPGRRSRVAWFHGVARPGGQGAHGGRGVRGA